MCAPTVGFPPGACPQMWGTKNCIDPMVKQSRNLPSWVKSPLELLPCGRHDRLKFRLQLSGLSSLPSTSGQTNSGHLLETKFRMILEVRKKAWMDLNLWSHQTGWCGVPIYQLFTNIRDFKISFHSQAGYVKNVRPSAALIWTVSFVWLPWVCDPTASGWNYGHPTAILQTDGNSPKFRQSVILFPKCVRKFLLQSFPKAYLLVHNSHCCLRPSIFSQHCS